MSEIADARETLGRAAELEKQVRARSGWYVRYLWMFAAWQLLLVPAVLLWHGPAASIGASVGNVLVVMALSAYAARQRVVRRGFALTHGIVMASWAVLYVLALVLGEAAFTDSPVFAAVAAVACALPLVTGALLERRRAA
ncbi:hypothetical protein [Streptomyces gilvosporeus]|uniref:Uncharacterized protein n=1 Tax=Streptomyces gilvosporeus TaxID=553510 RepID=A0A1V0TZS2_9ACTN|nr:hypothetical protein [Streptomyces gilvosporeus]ARF58290.1 hypothetical protein B1H19_32575 [Streptomyces gilvosporeus]